jgi:hypothetical protein
VINDATVGRLYELVEFCEKKGVDLVLLSFPWYIAEETSREKDGFARQHFDGLIDIDSGKRSWDALKYQILGESIHAHGERLCAISQGLER